MRLYRLAGLIGAGVIFGGGVLAEVAVRISGVTDFPVYTRSEKVGYYLSPGQHGFFLHRTHWYVDREGFNNDREFDGRRPYTLLVGDSVVYGGNPVDYADRVGTVVGSKAKQNVWVAAAGGWSLLNELAYLSQRKDIVRNADHLVIVYDHGDVDGLVPWQGEYTWPTKRPWLMAPYIVKRYLLPSQDELPPVSSSVSQCANSGWRAKLDELLAVYPNQLVLVLYPDKAAIGDAVLWQEQTKDIREYAAAHESRIRVVDVRNVPGWSISMYRDVIHPNTKGNRFLAGLISKQLVQLTSSL